MIFDPLAPGSAGKQFTRWTPFRAEGCKLLLDELLTQAGVELDTRKLVETLRSAGAYLPQKDLSPSMTRFGG